MRIQLVLSLFFNSYRNTVIYLSISPSQVSSYCFANLSNQPSLWTIFIHQHISALLVESPPVGLPVSDIQSPHPGPHHLLSLPWTQPKFDEISVPHHGLSMRNHPQGLPRIVSKMEMLSCNSVYLQTMKWPFFMGFSFSLTSQLSISKLVFALGLVRFKYHNNQLHSSNFTLVL